MKTRPTRRCSLLQSAADYGKHASSGIEVDISTLGALISNEVRYTAVPGVHGRLADYGKHASSGIEVDTSTLGALISNEVRYTSVPGGYGGLRIYRLGWGAGWSQSAANTHKYALSSQLCQSAASEWPRGGKGSPRCSKRWSKGAQKHVPGHPGGGLFGTLGSKRAPPQNIGI